MGGSVQDCGDDSIRPKAAINTVRISLPAGGNIHFGSRQPSDLGAFLGVVRSLLETGEASGQEDSTKSGEVSIPSGMDSSQEKGCQSHTNGPSGVQTSQTGTDGTQDPAVVLRGS